MTAMQQMLFAGNGARVNLDGHTISDNDDGVTGVAQANVSVDSDGNMYATTISGTAQIDGDTDWIRPIINPTGYHVRATLQSGDTPDSGTLNTWQALTSDRSWGHSRNTNGSDSCDLLLEISPDGGTTVVESGVYTLSVTVTGA